MNCPTADQWDLLAMEVLETEQSEAMLAHARICEQCRAALTEARRAHIDRVRMYEAFDRGHDDLREQMLAALPNDEPRRSPADRLARGWARLGEFTMSLNHPVRRTALVLVPAAAIILAVIFLVNPAQQSAFAAAIEQLRQARTIVCHITTPEGIDYAGVHVSLDGKLYLSNEFGEHTTMSLNGTPILQHYAPPNKRALIIQPPSRTYYYVDPATFEDTSFSAQTPAAWLERLRGMAADGAEEIGEVAENGRASIGYRVPASKLGYTGNSPNAENAGVEIWVDTKTRLPVKIVLHSPLAQGSDPLVMVFDRFEWDVPLDAGLFQPRLEGMVELDSRFASPSEAALLNGLDRIRDVTGGHYPPTLEGPAMLASLHNLLVKTDAMKNLDQLGQQGVMQFGIEVGTAGMYYMKLARDGCQPEYFGDTVTNADADKVLVRWKLPSGGTRVIYGDLRTETLP